jgi:hypothetical protein
MSVFEKHRINARGYRDWRQHKWMGCNSSSQPWNSTVNSLLAIFTNEAALTEPWRHKYCHHFLFRPHLSHQHCTNFISCNLKETSHKFPSAAVSHFQRSAEKMARLFGRVLELCRGFNSKKKNPAQAYSLSLCFRYQGIEREWRYSATNSHGHQVVSFRPRPI